MRIRSLIHAAVAPLAVAMLIAAPARAQDAAPGARRISVGLQLGGSLPTGELGDFYNTGIRGALTASVALPERPIALRATLSADRFGGATLVPAGGSPIELDAATMLSLALGAVIGESRESVAPYLLAGIGVHRLSGGDEQTPGEPGEEPLPGEPTIERAASETRAGATVGGGLRFRLVGRPAHLEVSAVRLFGANATIVPVVLGMEF